MTKTENLEESRIFSLNGLPHLPAGWSWVAFSTLITKVKRGPSKKCNTEGRGIRYITSGNLQGGKLSLDLDYKFLDDLSEIEKCRLFPEDLILNCVNSFEQIGKSAVFHETHGDAIVGFNNYALELNKAYIIPEYANIFCRSDLFLKQLHFLIKRAINQVSFATRELHLIAVALPPLNQQRRIVAKIKALNARSQRVKEELEAIPTLLDQFRQSVLAAAFRGDLTADWREKNPDVEPASVLLERIRAERRHRWEEAELEKMKDQGKTPKDDKWKEKYKEFSPINNPSVFEKSVIPTQWSWVTIGDVAECLDRMRVPINKDEREKRIGDIPYYGANGQVGWINDYIFDEALVIVVEDETFIGRTKPFCYKIFGKSWVNNHAHVLRATDAIEIDYLNYSLMFYPFIPLTSGSTGRRKLTQAALMSAPYPVAPLAEQQEIVRRVELFLKTAEQIEKQYQEGKVYLDQLDRSILAKTFRGELVPQDPNDEPTSVLLERIRAEREKLDTKKKAKGKTEKRSRNAKPEASEPEQLSLPGFE